MCKRIVGTNRYPGVCPTILVVAALWCIVIAIGYWLKVPWGNIMQTCATVLVGGLIPAFYYYLIALPAERNGALRKAMSEELGSIVKGLGDLYSRLQSAVKQSQYRDIEQAGYEIAHSATRLRALIVLAGNAKVIGEGTSDYLGELNGGVEEIMRAIRQANPSGEHKPTEISQKLQEAFTVVHYNHLAYVLYLYGDIQEPIPLNALRQKTAETS